MTNNKKKYQPIDIIMFIPALICGAAMMAVGFFAQVGPMVPWYTELLARSFILFFGMVVLWVFAPEKK